MKHWRLPLALLLAGCSSLAQNSDGVVGLELVLPTCFGLEPQQSLRLGARAINQAGDSVPAAIYWWSPDSLHVLTVDSVSGTIQGDSLGSAQVRARTGSIYSEFLTFTVNPRPDTLFSAGFEKRMLLDPSTTSTSLIAHLTTSHLDTTVVSFPVQFSIVFPTFATTADRSVELPGHVLQQTVCTSTVNATVQLLRITGTPTPDSVMVLVTSVRGDSTTVPGSPDTITVVFHTP